MRVADVTQHQSKLNEQLQGKNELKNIILEHITSFQKKLNLFNDQFSKYVVKHFPCLKTQHDEGLDNNYQQYCTMKNYFLFLTFALWICENLKVISISFLTH